MNSQHIIGQISDTIFHSDFSNRGETLDSGNN